MRILIIDNSYTGYNDLARLLTEIVALASVAQAVATEPISLMMPTCATIEVPGWHSTYAMRRNGL